MTSKNHRRRKRVFRRQTPPGAAPGTLITDRRAQPTVIRLLAYGPEAFEEKEITSTDQMGPELARWPVTWINVDGLRDAETIASLGRVFGLHKLALEDVINVHQRPKVEPYGDHLYMVARIINRGETLQTEQISFFLGKNFVLTFQEFPGDCFEPVRNRIRNAHGSIRNAGADFLAYALLDSVLDSYFPIIETMGEELEELEQDVILSPDKDTIAGVHRIKRELLGLRRAVWPLREAVNELIRDPITLIKNDTRIYLRDCYDHTIQIIDLLETYRELGSDLVDIYLSSTSNRMNEIMKVLTIIATIFIPLTFIAGLYGMNFNTAISPLNMPELNWKWGYPFSLILMGIVALGMLAFFYRRGWIGSSENVKRRMRKKAGFEDKAEQS